MGQKYSIIKETNRTQQSTQVVEEYEIHLALVPPELIENVLNFVHSPHDLLATSQTCKTLNKLSDEFFAKNCKSMGSVGIHISIYGQITPWNCEMYEIRFIAHIEDLNIKIESIEPPVMQSLFRFINEKCARRIRRLEMDFTIIEDTIRWEIAYLHRIAEQTENLEILLLREPPSIEPFLRQCQRLQTLCVVNKNKELSPSHQDEWMNTVNPNLKVFTYIEYLYEIDNAAHRPIDLTNFLINAPNMQAIGLSNLPAIRNFLATVRKMNYAELWFQSSIDIIDNMMPILLSCFDNKIDSLHLGIIERITLYTMLDLFFQIRLMKNVKVVHFKLDRTWDGDILHSVTIQPHLKVLCIRILDCDNMQFIYRLIKLFTHLEELCIAIDSDVCGNLNTYGLLLFDSKELLMLIAGHHKNLKRLSFEFGRRIDLIDFTDRDVAKMDFARSSLMESQFLTIVTDARINNMEGDSISITGNDQLGCLSCRMFRMCNNYSCELLSKYSKRLPIDQGEN